ncbi:MAG: nuclear transport factor 2 family protein [Alphaproteobacteria bacterium]
MARDTYGLAAVLALNAATAVADPYPSVGYDGPLEARDTKRGAVQWAFLDMARAWAECDRELLGELVTGDVRFAFPTTSLEGRAALLDALDAYCGPAASAPPEEVSFHLPDDAFYIDLETGRAAVEIQFRELRRGRDQVINDVWIATFADDGRFAIMKEYLDGRVRDLQELGVLTRDRDAEFLTPWPPRTEAWSACFPIVRAAPINRCPPE